MMFVGFRMRVLQLSKGTGNPQDWVRMSMQAVTYLGLYIGFGAVCVGVFKYEPPAGVWDGEIPPVSLAVACTMLLSCTFFFIYLLLAVSRTYSQYVGGQLFTSNFEIVMLRAADTLAMAPMLCVLFLAARMRALQ